MAIIMCMRSCPLGAGNRGIEGKCYAKLSQGGRVEGEKVAPQYPMTGQTRGAREQTMFKKSQFDPEPVRSDELGAERGEGERSESCWSRTIRRDYEGEEAGD